MTPEDRQDVTLGVFDGVVSITGFILGLQVHRASAALIVAGGVGGLVSATVSMGTGEFEAAAGVLRRRLHRGLVMAAATVTGSAIPLWPFLLVPRGAALTASGVSCLAAAGWIGWEKRRGWRGYLEAYSTIVGAIGAAFLVVALAPVSG